MVSLWYISPNLCVVLYIILFINTPGWDRDLFNCGCTVQVCFVLCSDEVAVAVMALSCCLDNPNAAAAISRSLYYLQWQRHADGSYGNIYTTALVLQVRYTPQHWCYR